MRRHGAARSRCLSRTEIWRVMAPSWSLTGCRSLSSQMDALKADRIPHRVMRNRLLVSRFHVREWLAGRVPNKVGGSAPPALAN